MPNLRYTARGRPQIKQRRLTRVEYLALVCDLTRFDMLAIRARFLLQTFGSRLASN
jgi:hypothetical protein